MKSRAKPGGREWSWPPKLIDEVNRRNAGVEAEFVMLGGTRMDEPTLYAVLVDRISHEVPYYRSYLKKAVLDGAAVINNPFMGRPTTSSSGPPCVPSSGWPTRRRSPCRTRTTCWGSSAARACGT
ncbi:MAG: hypothetical protein U0871_05080 [Gemmataceae bacterium]